MAIDPRLVSIKTAAELPVSDPSDNANFLFYEDEALKRSPMSNIYEKLQSGIKGVATAANSPTAWTSGDPYLFERYSVDQFEVKTNFKDSSNNPINVTAADLDGNLVEIWVENGVARKVVMPLPNGKSAYQLAVEAGFSGTEIEWLESLNGTDGKGVTSIAKTSTVGEVDTYTITYSDATTTTFTVTNANAAKIVTWTAKPFASGVQVIYEGEIYESNATTVNGDIPGVSSKWVKVIATKPTINGQSLLEIVDADENIIAKWDKEGKLKTNHAKDTVDADALLGNKRESNNIAEFLDSEENLFGFVDRDGNWRLPKLIVDELKIGSSSSTGGDSTVTSENFVSLPKMDFCRIDIVGNLPTDASETRTATNVTITFRQGDVKLATVNAEMAIQGHGSAALSKKGYEFSFLNKKREKIKIKFGDMADAKSINYKAFHTDITHTRDVGNGRLWKQIARTRTYPNNLIRPHRNDWMPLASYNPAEYMKDDANFYAEGFPTVAFLNGEFLGLYTIRQKKPAENYALDEKNQNHIFLDSDNPGGGLGMMDYASFDAMNYYFEVRSPKTPTQLTKDNIMRFFTWCRGVVNGTVNISTTYQDYIVLESWIDFVIMTEFIHNWDGVANKNNYNIISYDGLHWQFMLYDTDQSLGIEWGAVYNSKPGMTGNSDVFQSFRTAFLPQIKERYTWLRKNNILTMRNFYDVYGGIAKNIPREVYQKNYEKWGVRNIDTGIPDMNHLYTFAKSSIDYLDNAWLIN